MKPLSTSLSHASNGLYFRQEISNWLQLCNIYNVIDFTKPVNVMFGLLDINDHFMPLNHSVILSSLNAFFDWTRTCHVPWVKP